MTAPRAAAEPGRGRDAGIGAPRNRPTGTERMYLPVHAAGRRAGQVLPKRYRPADCGGPRDAR